MRYTKSVKGMEWSLGYPHTCDNPPVSASEVLGIIDVGHYVVLFWSISWSSVGGMFASVLGNTGYVGNTDALGWRDALQLQVVLLLPRSQVRIPETIIWHLTITITPALTSKNTCTPHTDT